MKHLLLSLILVPGMLLAADLRLATVDLLLLVRNHPDYDRNEKFINSKAKDLKAKTDAIKSEGEKLQAEGKKMMEQYRNPMLNDKTKAELEGKLRDLEQKLIEIEQKYRSESLRGQDDIQGDRARMLKETTEDLKARLKKFAEKEKYDLILDANAAPFAKDSFDVTDAVLRDMGVDPLKAKGRESANEGK